MTAPQLPPSSLAASSILPAVANMSNSILGAGIVGLPYALSLTGMVPGVILLLVLGVATDYTLSLVLLNAKLAGSSSYIGFVNTALGFPGRVAVSFFQFAFAFGGMAAFSLIIGDTIPHVISALLPPSFASYFTRTSVLVIFTLFLSYPLSLYRRIDKLSHASAFALISMSIIITTVALRGPAVDPSLKGTESPTLFNFHGVFQAIGVISFAFVCHHNSMLIYESLDVPSIDTFARVTHFSTILSVIASLTMAVSGFLAFREKTLGNILNNFSPDDFWINIARLCFGLNMVTTIPLECFVCREVIESCFFNGTPLETKYHIIVTTGLVFSALSVSLLTCDLGLVLEIAGGFAASSISYIFPAMSYLVLTAHFSQKNGYDIIPSLPSTSLLEAITDPPSEELDEPLMGEHMANSITEEAQALQNRINMQKRKRNRILSWVSTVFGFTVMILSTTMTLMRDRSDTQKTC